MIVKIGSIIPICFVLVETFKPKSFGRCDRRTSDIQTLWLRTLFRTFANIKQTAVHNLDKTQQSF